MEFKDSEIKEFAKSKVKELTKELEKWNKVLEAFGENEKNNNMPAKGTTHKVGLKVLGKVNVVKLTVKQMVLEVLNQVMTPLTSRDIMNLVNEKFNKQYTLDTFSGAFSVMYRREDSGISQYNLQNATVEVKAVYGLSRWFLDENTLKDEYKEKLKERYGNY